MRQAIVTAGRLLLVAVVLWAPLSIGCGYVLAAFGTGSLGGGWVLAGCVFFGLLYSPVFAIALDS